MADNKSSQSPYDIPYDELSNPRQVWVGEPGSEEEGKAKLGMLTPEVVHGAAASEIRTGRRVTMGWTLTELGYPNLGRQPCKHRIVPLLDGLAFDDYYEFNPRRLLSFWLVLRNPNANASLEQSSQWDGLRHFSQTVPGQSERVFYGGTTAAEIYDRKNDRIGMQHWAKEGIAGMAALPQ